MQRKTNILIGESDCYLEVLEQASQLTSLNRPVLVVGERGTGKELIAERLHFLSARWAKPLIKMNCAAVNDALLESELFGHEAGAFTGANRRHIGRFERANGGTLFLDEVATMSTKTQEKLLRFIEYKEFERVGGSDALTADVRLVAATNVDLPSLADAGEFRHDLLDRLAFDVITLPPLRERKEDILLLAEHFAVNMCKELELPFFSGFTAYAQEMLQSHPWPGNIRELKNAVERSVYRHQDSSEPVNGIQLDPFASPYRLSSPPPPPAVATAETTKKTDRKQSPHILQLPLDFKKERSKFERELLNKAMEQARYNQRDAAKLLGLTYHQLRSSLRKHKLQTGPTTPTGSH